MMVLPHTNFWLVAKEARNGACPYWDDLMEGAQKSSLLLSLSRVCISWLLLSPAGYRYYTCLIHNCSAQPHTAPFPGPIDRGSLTVQDEYIFLKVSVPSAGRGQCMTFCHRKSQ